MLFPQGTTKKTYSSVLVDVWLSECETGSYLKFGKVHG